MTDYNDLPGVRSSDLKLMLTSPMAYAYHLTNGREETAAMRLGTATHMAILEPDRFEATYIITPESVNPRTNDGRAWIASHPNALSQAEFERLRGMYAAVQRHPVARSYLSRIVSVETVVEWVDKESGLACKARLDAILDDGSILDLKTTKCADADKFARDCATYEYPFSMAFYRMGRVANGHPVPKVILLAVESTPPHDVGPFILDDDTLECCGDEKVRTCLTRLAECQVTGRFPGRYGTEQDLIMPPWAYPTDKPEALKGWDETEGGDDD